MAGAEGGGPPATATWSERSWPALGAAGRDPGRPAQDSSGEELEVGGREGAARCMFFDTEKNQAIKHGSGEERKAGRVIW